MIDLSGRIAESIDFTRNYLEGGEKNINMLNNVR